MCGNKLIDSNFTCMRIVLISDYDSFVSVVNCILHKLMKSMHVYTYKRVLHLHHTMMLKMDFGIYWVLA